MCTIIIDSTNTNAYKNMIVESDFIPAKGLQHPDIQSILPTFARWRTKVAMRSERLELEDGDFLDLEWVGQGNGPIVLLLHGMAGNADSPYIKGAMQEIVQRGWRGVMMYYRGCSRDTNRLPKTYHLGQSEDFDIFVRHVAKTHPTSTLFAAGFSMGGNILLKWLGENPKQKLLTAAVAVSAPYDLRAAAAQIRRGKGRFYQWMLMRDLRRYVRKKYNYPLAPVDVSGLDSIKSFWDLDDKVTAPMNGFDTAENYYRKASCGPHLKNILTPTLILHSIDDPMIPPKTIPTEDKLSAAITLELSQKGGHVGFISGTMRNPIFWLDSKIINFFIPFNIEKTPDAQNDSVAEKTSWQESA